MGKIDGKYLLKNGSGGWNGAKMSDHEIPWKKNLEFFFAFIEIAQFFLSKINTWFLLYRGTAWNIILIYAGTSMACIIYQIVVIIDKNSTKLNYHVSRLLNFLVTTFPMSIPSLSTILCARSGCDVPLKTLMFGILLCNTPQRDFSKFARNKLLARTGWDTGITV